MTEHRGRYGPHDPAATYVEHEFGEQIVDLGEVEMNYASAGGATLPALLCIPGQTESWWGYEAVMPRLAEHFQVFAVDLRGQGRSTRTPGRYTLDNMGNDLVRFIDLVIARPAIVSGLSSGGVLSAWLSAYAKPGQVVAAHYEDPPLFSSEVRPAVGPGMRQTIGPMFDLWSTFLGDQWSIGAWDAMRQGAATHLPEQLRFIPVPDEPPQQLKEYDPEWGRAFWSGTVAASCDHERMLRSVKVRSVLLTHHMRTVDAGTGFMLGAMSDQQVQRARDLLADAGAEVDYRSFPDVGHSMHGERPDLYVETLLDWAEGIGA
jgi:pimeloyl-ACP methyl ester carboxylesterase